jgi:four helix bundle protein
MQDFRKLRVWHEANALTLSVYGATRGFPDEERFGLTSQMRKAAASIQSNIAEGSGRRTRPDIAHFIQTAIGSSAELTNQLLLSRDLGYLEPGDFTQLNDHVNHVSRMLVRLLFRLRTRRPKA